MQDDIRNEVYFAAMYFLITVFLDLSPFNPIYFKDVSEERAASVFSVEKCA
jgi:hypothetical protein